MNSFLLRRLIYILKNNLIYKFDFGILFMKYDLSDRRELDVVNGFSRQREEFLHDIEVAIRAHAIIQDAQDTRVTFQLPYKQVLQSSPRIDEEARIISYPKGVVLVEHYRFWLEDRKRFRGKTRFHVFTNNGGDGSKLFSALVGVWERYSAETRKNH